jgi:beta-glucanase (GH16 family)
VIEARKEEYSGLQYTSARLRTEGLGEWAYGRFEGRIQIPRGQGIWPAFWMMGATGGGWPYNGEIDIMENIGKEPGRIHGTVHGPGYSGAHGPTSPYDLASGAFADDFHVYAVEWEPAEVRWYMDDQLYKTLTPKDIGDNKWVFDHPFYILLNVAVGGGWPGYPNETSTFPQTMLVDYVRVYQK